MSRTVEERLKDALLHIGKIEMYIKRSLNDDAIVDAIALRIASLVDTLTGLPAPMRDEMFPGAWNAMRGLRNRVAHGYQSVNPEVLELTAQLDIPQVKKLFPHSYNNSHSQMQTASDTSGSVSQRDRQSQINENSASSTNQR